MTSRATKLQSYLDSGIHAVDGWLDPFTARMMADLACYQSELGLTGGLVEIGVHHGKSFLVLELVRAESERSLAIDLFELQHLNVDRSGKGDLGRFHDNLDAHALGSDGVRTLARSSLDVRAAEIHGVVGPVRLFSIDGSHTEAATANDLALADETLDAAGIVVVDDFFDQGWPGVSVAVTRWLLEHPGRLRPFLITPKKLYLAREDWAERYRRFAERSRPMRIDKSSEMLGHPVTIMGTTELTFRRRVRRSPIGPLAARLLRR